jgi:hypothetical protein
MWHSGYEKKNARSMMRRQHGDNWHQALKFGELSVEERSKLFKAVSAVSSPGRVTAKVRVSKCAAPPRRTIEKRPRERRNGGKVLEFDERSSAWASKCYCGAASSALGPWCSDACGGCGLTAATDNALCDFLNDGNRLCGHHQRLAMLAEPLTQERRVLEDSSSSEEEDLLR